MMSPFEWMHGAGWDQASDEVLVEELGASVVAQGPRHSPERCRHVVEVLRWFKAEATIELGVYLEAGIRVAEDVCHAVFGSNVSYALAAGPERRRRVLVSGEVGTDRGRIGRLIGRSIRRLHEVGEGTDWSVSAADLPGPALQSELFGHEKGAFVGARDRRAGVLAAMCDGDSLFIDEIDEASRMVQGLLLGTLREGTFRSMGALGKRQRHLHLVAGTARSERELTDSPSFRADLYYRLACPRVHLPPLREFAAPTETFERIVTQVVAEELGHLDVHGLGAALAKATSETGYTWPGNLGELRQVIVQLAYSDTGPAEAVVARLQAGQAADVAVAEVAESAATSERPPTLAELKRAAYEGACARNFTVTAVAKELDVSRQTAHERIKDYGLSLRPR